MIWIKKVQIFNFRLLADVELLLEQKATLVVGRNNSGKTSLSEVIRRFLSDTNPRFQIEDFSSVSYDRFCEALRAKNADQREDEVRALIPGIELRLYIQYDPAQPELGPLSDFVIDLDPDCNEALVVARYELRDGAVGDLFADQPAEELNDDARLAFFRTLRERIPALYAIKIWAEDPNDQNNRKQMPTSALRSLLKTGFVNAQRGLDDNTSRETDVLARILEGLFSTAISPTADEDEQRIAQALQEAVQDIQQRIDENFNVKLKDLIPTLETFGYPGLGGSEIATETTLDVKRLLTNHTKVKYAGHSGILLPESYNGLGVRNLIFILLRIVSFYREFRAEQNAPGVHLIFIEEPEAHLHPQMQEVFIRQLTKIAHQLNAKDGGDQPWPIQFVVSTHSSHIANAAGFETIRYFLSKPTLEAPGAHKTVVKDLRYGLRNTAKEHKKFLHQYLTLTRCDLFFADKAILIEGTGERLLLPIIIDKMESANPAGPKLSSQYITIMEVGGAYAHLFFDLLDFLELRSLIITDIDSVDGPGGAACPVHQGAATSNACLKTWFADEDCSPTALLAKVDDEKIKGVERIAFQRPEIEDGPCGRTLEDAFMLANREVFGIAADDRDQQEWQAWELVGKIKKSEFALKYSIDETEWSAPGYILDGLAWLAAGEPTAIDPGMAMVADAAAATASGSDGDQNG